MYRGSFPFLSIAKGILAIISITSCTCFTLAISTFVPGFPMLDKLASDDRSKTTSLVWLWTKPDRTGLVHHQSCTSHSRIRPAKTNAITKIFTRPRECRSNLIVRQDGTKYEHCSCSCRIKFIWEPGLLSAAMMNVFTTRTYRVWTSVYLLVPEFDLSSALQQCKVNLPFYRARSIVGKNMMVGPN